MPKTQSHRRSFRHIGKPTNTIKHGEREKDEEKAKAKEREREREGSSDFSGFGIYFEGVSTNVFPDCLGQQNNASYSCLQRFGELDCCPSPGNRP